MKTLLAALAVAFALAAPVVPALAEADIKVAIHVDEDDPARMNMALNNAQNVEAYYKEQGKTVEIAIVAYGPGLTMLRSDTSPVAQRLASMQLEYPQIHLQACANTMAGIEKKEGAKPPLIDGVEVVPSGVVQLIELQRQGWAYVRP